MAIYNYYFYKTATGEITRSIPGDLTVDTTLITRNIEVGESVYESSVFLDYNTQYIPSGVVTERPLLTDVISWNKTTFQADHIDSAIVSGLPNPSNVFIAGVSNTNILDTNITDGSLELKTNIAGNYTVIITHFPYQEYQTTIIGV